MCLLQKRTHTSLCLNGCTCSQMGRSRFCQADKTHNGGLPRTSVTRSQEARCCQQQTFLSVHHAWVLTDPEGNVSSNRRKPMALGGTAAGLMKQEIREL